jgi:phosphoenolpyruvate-protein kinase (PTS system EI component)
LHPGVLRLIHEIVNQVHAARRQVTVCGEMAGDRRGAVALAALQVDGLSVAVNQFTATHELLTRLRVHDIEGLRSRLLRTGTAKEVRDCLDQFQPWPPS